MLAGGEEREPYDLAFPEVSPGRDQRGAGYQTVGGRSLGNGGREAERHLFPLRGAAGGPGSGEGGKRLRREARPAAAMPAALDAPAASAQLGGQLADQ